MARKCKTKKIVKINLSGYKEFCFSANYKGLNN